MAGVHTLAQQKGQTMMHMYTPNRVRNKQKSASPQPSKIPSGQKD